jgi:hypothetical protein
MNTVTTLTLTLSLQKGEGNTQDSFSPVSGGEGQDEGAPVHLR